MGGGARSSLSPLSEDHRSLVCHRLQVCAAGTSNAGEADSMRKRFVNSSGGDICETLDASYYKGQGSRQGAEREYVVVISKSNRSSDGERISEVRHTRGDE